VLVNEIVAQLVNGHSPVQDIRKFVFFEFPDHCSSILMLAHSLAEMGDAWKSDGTFQ
jgi:hypothetical protein